MARSWYKAGAVLLIVLGPSIPKQGKMGRGIARKCEAIVTAVGDFGHQNHKQLSRKDRPLCSSTNPEGRMVTIDGSGFNGWPALTAEGLCDASPDLS